MKNFMRYESVAELHDALRNAEPLKVWKDSFERVRKDMSDEECKKFAGCTFAEAFELLDKGDAKCAAMIKAEGEILNEAQGGAMPKIEVGVYGCIPSVPNYLRGVPTNMMRVVREPRHNPIIDVYVDTGISYGVKCKQAAIAAAKIANVITAVEMSGVRVNLYAVSGAEDAVFFGTKDKGDAAGFAVKIKEANAPLNLLNIAFPMTNPAFCRVVSLHWQECNLEWVWSGHGNLMAAKTIAETFGLDGLTLSVQETISYGYSLETIARKFNEYLKTK